VVAPWLAQRPYEVRFEWGPAGIGPLSADVVVIVDVLRFTTAVDAAVGNGVAVYPYRWRDRSASAFANRIGARLADGAAGSPSLSPGSLLGLPPGAAVVLPSPNGSTCAALAHEAGALVVAACLRNASAVAAWVAGRPGSVAVVACGERWPDGSLRPALEDHLGAGAVLAGLVRRDLSPEARAAVAVWRDGRERIADVLAACSSGREQHERGWSEDLRYASDVDASGAVPALVDGAFRDASAGGG
jgi:2-phosphosulfolactate phosphatase